MSTGQANPNGLRIHSLPACQRMIEAAGHTTQSFGLGRTIGQIFALLFLSPNPLCLDDIVSELGVSKASVSTAVRQLERWSAAHRVWIKGDRKDYYEAETDFQALLTNGLVGLVRKKIHTAGNQLGECEKSLQESIEESDAAKRRELRIIADRLQKAGEFHDKISSLLSSPLIEKIL